MPTTSDFAAALDQLERVLPESQTRFGALSPAALNWQPSPDVWSIAQCFDHLRLVNETYLVGVAATATDSYQPTGWAKLPLLPSGWGRLLRWAVTPQVRMRVSSPIAVQPATSEFPASVIADFGAVHEQLIEAFRKVAAIHNPDRTIITSPIAKGITLSITDACHVCGQHTLRHLNQASRVMQTAGFPS